jgi:hypothetical protein
MSENKKKILEMLAQNKISADDAYRLLSAVDSGEVGHGNAGHDSTGHENTGNKGPGEKIKAKYLRVTVTPDEEGANKADGSLFKDGKVGRVNVRVPMSLIRAGIKLKSLVPPEAMDKVNQALKEKGINFDVNSIRNEDIEELIDALGDMQIDVEGGRGEKVRVYVE